MTKTKWKFTGPWYRRFTKDARRNMRAARSLDNDRGYRDALARLAQLLGNDSVAPTHEGGHE